MHKLSGLRQPIPTVIPLFDDIRLENESCQLFYLKIDPIGDDSHKSEDSDTTAPVVQLILNHFTDTFTPKNGLPPTRPMDHEIILHPAAEPVKVRPYRYPYHQKVEISKLVEDMLRDGVIQPSRSPFSSPVILVKKKNRSWCFCVNYRALNEITVKDAYPIPTAGEIFDELHEAKYFSKINLKSGFHLIRLTPDVVPKSDSRRPLRILCYALRTLQCPIHVPIHDERNFQTAAAAVRS